MGQMGLAGQMGQAGRVPKNANTVPIQFFSGMMCITNCRYIRQLQVVDIFMHSMMDIQEALGDMSPACAEDMQDELLKWAIHTADSMICCEVWLTANLVSTLRPDLDSMVWAAGEAPVQCLASAPVLRSVVQRMTSEDTLPDESKLVEFREAFFRFQQGHSFLCANFPPDLAQLLQSLRAKESLRASIVRFLESALECCSVDVDGNGGPIADWRRCVAQGNARDSFFERAVSLRSAQSNAQGTIDDYMKTALPREDHRYCFCDGGDSEDCLAVGVENVFLYKDAVSYAAKLFAMPPVRKCLQKLLDAEVELTESFWRALRFENLVLQQPSLGADGGAAAALVRLDNETSVKDMYQEARLVLDSLGTTSATNTSFLAHELFVLIEKYVYGLDGVRLNDGRVVSSTTATMMVQPGTLLKAIDGCVDPEPCSAHLVLEASRAYVLASIVGCTQLFILVTWLHDGGSVLKGWQLDPRVETVCKKIVSLLKDLQAKADVASKEYATESMRLSIR